MKKQLTNKIEMYAYKIKDSEKVFYRMEQIPSFEMMVNGFEYCEILSSQEADEWGREIQDKVDELLAIMPGVCELESLEYLIALLTDLRKRNTI